VDLDVLVDMEVDAGLNAGLEIEGDPGAALGLDSAFVGVIPADYELLEHKPSIEGVTLIGDKTFQALGLGPITEQEIDNIIFGGA